MAQPSVRFLEDDGRNQDGLKRILLGPVDLFGGAVNETRDAMAASGARFLASKHRTFLCAFIDDGEQYRTVTVGFCNIEKVASERRWYLYELEVFREHRGQGYGQQWVRQLLRLLHDEPEPTQLRIMMVSSVHVAAMWWKLCHLYILEDAFAEADWEDGMVPMRRGLDRACLHWELACRHSDEVVLLFRQLTLAVIEEDEAIVCKEE